MHWTAFLAYRRLPPNAQVIDDLACIDCGYNLRGLLVSARCPECGGEVGKSLFVLARPETVARCIRSAAKCYLADLAFFLGCLAAFAAWPWIVIAAVLAIASIWRAVAAIQLYRHGALDRLHVIGARLWLWCIAACVESLAAIGLFMAAVAITQSGGPMSTSLDRLLSLALITWVLCLAGSAAIASWFGLAMANLLGYGWMRIEFRVQIALTTISASITLASMAIANSSVAAGWWPATGLLFAMSLAAIVIGSWVSLSHLANACQQQDATWEDAIDRDRIAVRGTGPDSQNPPREPPPIKVQA